MEGGEDFGARCVQLWICSAEPHGEHCYENWNNNGGRRKVGEGWYGIV